MNVLPMPFCSFYRFFVSFCINSNVFKFFILFRTFRMDGVYCAILPRQKTVRNKHNTFVAHRPVNYCLSEALAAFLS